MPLKPCLGCGQLAAGSRCRTCNAASPYQQPAWRRVSRAVAARDGSCRLCGSTHRLSAHHITARDEGGADMPNNLVALCVACHARLEARKRASR